MSFFPLLSGNARTIPLSLTTTDATAIYTAFGPAQIGEMQFTETAGATPSVVVSLTRSGTTWTVFRAALTANSATVTTFPLILRKDDVVKVTASAANQVVALATVLEAAQRSSG